MPLTAKINILLFGLIKDNHLSGPGSLAAGLRRTGNHRCGLLTPKKRLYDSVRGNMGLELIPRKSIPRNVSVDGMRRSIPDHGWR